MGTKQMLGILLMILSVGVSAQTVGLIDVTDKDVMLHVTQPLDPDHQVSFQYRVSYNSREPDDSIHCCVSRPVSAFELLLHEKLESVYVLRGGIPKQVAPGFAGAAIIAPKQNRIKQRDEQTIQTKGLQVKTCLSSEGLHVQGTSGRKIERLYHSFGFPARSACARSRDLGE